jgi:hypothetical protein
MLDNGNKNRLKNLFKSSQLFHRTHYERVRKTTVQVQLELRKLKFFDLIAQEQDQLLSANTLNRSGKLIHCLFDSRTENWERVSSTSPASVAIEISAAGP